MAILRQGSKGEDVRLLQQQLKAAGYDPGPIDADYGPLTAGAVTAFQKAKGLGVDAVVGPQTWGALQGLTTTPATTTRTPAEADVYRQAAGLGIPESQVDPAYLKAINTGTVKEYQAPFIKAGAATAPSTTIPQGLTQVAASQPSALGTTGQTPSFTMPEVNLTPRYDYSDEIQAALQALRGNIDNANVTPEQIVSSPEYLAQKGVLDLQRGESMAALRRDLASRTMLQSTPAIQTLTTAQGEADIRAGALVPQMMGEARGQLQQQIANQLQGLQTLANQQKTEDQYTMQKAQLLQDVANTQRNFGLSESGVTGTYQGQPTYAATQATTAAAQRQAEARQTAVQKQAEAQQTAAQKQAEFDWAKQQDTTANQLNQQQFDWTKQYQQGVLNKPAAAAAATVRTPKQQYEDTIYNKMINGVPLTQAERNYIEPTTGGTSDYDLRSQASKMAQADPRVMWNDEITQAEIQGIIDEYVNYLKTGQMGGVAAPNGANQGATTPPSETDIFKGQGWLKE